MKEGTVTITTEEYLKLKKLEEAYESEEPFYLANYPTSNHGIFNVSYDEINKKLLESVKSFDEKLKDYFHKGHLRELKKMNWFQFRKWKRL